jgi:hypothetical protein
VINDQDFSEMQARRRHSVRNIFGKQVQTAPNGFLGVSGEQLSPFSKLNNQSSTKKHN